MRPARLERATYGFEVRYSIQMSYERKSKVDDEVCPPLGKLVQGG